ncbi:putative Ciliary dynein heavy chain, partial [Operophtera brumata]
MNIKGLEDFKLVMATITLVQAMTITAEVRYRGMQELFNMLRQHDIDVSDEDLAFAKNLEASWGGLYQTSLFRGNTLEGTKEKFSKLNVVEISNYLRELDDFVEKFDNEGPATEYSKYFDEFEARKRILQAAEQLFDNPLADFSNFNRAKTDFQSMEQIYKIYKAQKKAREIWARTLWVNLNPQALVDGIEQFFKEYRKLPKAVRLANTGLMLDLKMKQFKGVVPLMVSLKNEAMRERHWKELMIKTPPLSGQISHSRSPIVTDQDFDMSPDRFTLENMFAMELHKYLDTWERRLSLISEIIEEWLATQRKWLYLEGIFVGGDIRVQLPEEAKKCQKSLNDYLDSKRRVFPRFFFISTDELLSILGASECSCVQEHMIKKGNKRAMKEHLQEQNEQLDQLVVKVRQGMVCLAADGVWWTAETEETFIRIKNGNKRAMKEHLQEQNEQLDQLVVKVRQGMVCLAADGVWWTAETEETFIRIKKGHKRAMKEHLQEQNEQLDQLVVKVRQGMVCLAADGVWWTAETEETFIRIKKGHKRAMKEHLQEQNEQLDQLVVKFRTIATIDIHARDIIEGFVRDNVTEAAEFEWERPAGTGKTETTKDLAKALGLLCVVTNCGEGMDFRAVGQILAGLCQCGAWGCFDEFNRIDISVLSVISTQLQCIRSALLMKLKRKVGIFITMNPGYAGRTELPESVKALFRPVVCILPDLEMICMISLFSDGFLTAKLSKQSHYDWGLRALTAVLRMCGKLRRESVGLSEIVVLMRALRDMNYPKFVYEDVPLFLGLIKDLFPGLECPRVGYPEFNAAVLEVLQSDGYIVIFSGGQSGTVVRDDDDPPAEQNEFRYSLFDGDVDALWIENMNSVMDDNRLLTLANGERIRLAPYCALLFEVGDLNYASPATVSRAGMVYVDPKNLGYQPYWDRWVRARTNEEEREKLDGLFEHYVPGAINYIVFGLFGLQQQTPLKTIVPQTPLNLVVQLCYMITGLMPNREDTNEEMDWTGFYDRGKDLTWKNLKDIGFLAAMGKAGGGRNDIIIVELPPTPAKFHYIFNLRDLSRIAAGMCLTHPSYFSEKRTVVRCWRNEFTRVICDRLINMTDNEIMQVHMHENIVKFFPEDEPVVLEEIVLTEEDMVDEVDEFGDPVIKEAAAPASTTGAEPTIEEEEEVEVERIITLEEYVLRDPLLFSDYRNALDEEEVRYYEDLLDYEAVFFLFQEDCLEHLTRTHRILRMDRGNALIIGVGGSGKKSICRLAAFAAGCEIFEITVTRVYNENTFKDDMKRMYNQLGVDNKKTVFLFTAAQ